MEVGQIIVLGDDLSTPWEIEGLKFLTEKIAGVYISQKPGELQFAHFNHMYFYAPNKDFIEKQDLISKKYFTFQGKNHEVEDINSIDLVSLMPVSHG